MLTYALIDGATRDDTTQAIRYYTQGFPARSLFTNQPERDLANAGPWLAQLDGNTGLQRWLLALDISKGAVARLTSDASFDTVFCHLENCLELTLATGEKTLFRFWDGRVLDRLRYILSSRQLNDLLGPIDTWGVKLGSRTFEITMSDLNAAA